MIIHDKTKLTTKIKEYVEGKEALTSQSLSHMADIVVFSVGLVVFIDDETLLEVAG